jgi:hypothetical protein
MSAHDRSGAHGDRGGRSNAGRRRLPTREAPDWSSGGQAQAAERGTAAHRTP